jgi:hypothetical protein
LEISRRHFHFQQLLPLLRDFQQQLLLLLLYQLKVLWVDQEQHPSDQLTIFVLLRPQGILVDQVDPVDY